MLFYNILALRMKPSSSPPREPIADSGATDTLVTASDAATLIAPSDLTSSNPIRVLLPDGTVLLLNPLLQVRCSCHSQTTGLIRHVLYQHMSSLTMSLTTHCLDL